MKESYYAKQFESMLGTIHYSMEKQEDGSYAVYNSQSRSYISSGDDIRSFENAKEVAEHINAAIGENIVDSMHEAIANILYETYKTDLSTPDELEEFSSIVDADEIDKYIKEHPDVRDKLWEKDYGDNVGYLDLLVNHLDDVNIEYLFDKKFYDDIEVTSNPEPFIYVEQNDVMNVFLEIGTDTLTELLRNTEFEFGEQTEAVKYANKALDTEAADINFGDLYVDFDMKSEKEPVYELTVTKLSGEQETYFSNSEGADRMKVTPEIEKAVINAVEQFSGKSLEETINDFRKECDKEIE